MIAPFNVIDELKKLSYIGAAGGGLLKRFVYPAREFAFICNLSPVILLSPSNVEIPSFALTGKGAGNVEKPETGISKFPAFEATTA